MRIRLWAAGLSLTLWAFPLSGAKARSTQPLFFIERTLNANIVRYDAQCDADRGLDPREPVIAYWLLHAEDGRRAPLNLVEKRMAYGFRIDPAPNPGQFFLTLVAFQNRAIQVYLRDGRARAELPIAQRPAYLEKILVSTRGPLGRPEFLELYGRDCATGGQRRERINAP